MRGELVKDRPIPRGRAANAHDNCRGFFFVAAA